MIIPDWIDFKISKNKSFEYQFEGPSSPLVKTWQRLILFGLSNWFRQDHGGIGFEFGIAGLFWINIQIYDHRHWDYENNRWEIYNNEPA